MKRGKMLGGKKAQFYLVAAVIIVMIVYAIITVKTYTVARAEPRKIKDVSAELKEETARIVDYGIYNSVSINMDELIEDFLYNSDASKSYGEYFLQKTENTTIVFVYGDATNLYAAEYKQESTGGVTATVGSSSTNWPTSVNYLEKYQIQAEDIKDNKVKVNILNEDYYFDVRANEMFYFIIVQEKEGEKYVERN